MTHEQNLNDFKHGFLKDGGEFTIWEKRQYKDDDGIEEILIAEGTVSYKDLHGVSKGVRDILQNYKVDVERSH